MKSRKKILAVLVLISAGVLGVNRSYAQDKTDKGTDATPAATAQDSTDNGKGAATAGGEAPHVPTLTGVTGLEGLNNRLNLLEKQTVVLTVEHNYLDFSNPDGDVIFKIGGVVQGDYRSYFAPATSYDDYLPIGGGTSAAPANDELGATGPAINKSTSTFLDRKVRLDLIAIFDHLAGFRYQAEFGSTGYAIQDAYAFIKADPALQFQLGKFKVPIGLERLQNDTDNLFVERSLATDLAPNRDLGVELNGTPWTGANYAVALTNGTPDNYTPNNADDSSLTDGRELTGRLFLTPFSPTDSFLKGLGVGISGGLAWNVNWNSNALPNYFITSLGQQQFFAYRAGVSPQGNFYHLSPQAYFYNGPFGLLGEYVKSTQDVGTGTATAVNLDNQAYLLEASWVLGGKASYLGAVADTNLDLRKGHWGALEVAVRVHQLTIDPSAFNPTAAKNLAATNSAQQATAFGAGLNWIFDPHFKLVFDWEETDFVEGTQVAPVVAGTATTLHPEDVFTVRAQANF